MTTEGKEWLEISRQNRRTIRGLEKKNAPWCLTAEYYLINVSAPRDTHIVQWLSHRFRVLIVGLDCTWGAPIHTGAHEKH